MHSYPLVDGKVALTHCVPSNIENECTHNIVVTLKQKFQPRFRIKAFGRDNACFCTFMGGGDVHIFVESGSSAANEGAEATEGADENATEGADENAEGVPLKVPATNITPPKKGEYRYGTMENKLMGQQSELDAQLQLQADRVLTSTTLIHQTMKGLKNPAELNVNTLTCYRMLMGPTNSLKLLY